MKVVAFLSKEEAQKIADKNDVELPNHQDAVLLKTGAKIVVNAHAQYTVVGYAHDQHDVRDAIWPK